MECPPFHLKGQGKLEVADEYLEGGGVRKSSVVC